MSRPAISQHIKILTECGLVTINKLGRERYCEAKLDKLNEVSSWIEQYREFWNIKLDALEDYLQKLQSKTHKSNPLSSNLKRIKPKKNGKRKK